MNLQKLQIVQLCGRLTKDPVLKETINGKLVMEFYLAYFTRSTADKEGSHTSFILIEAWESLAERLILKLKKGMQVIVKGELIQNRWKNEQAESFSRIKLTAENIEISDLKRRPAPEDIQAENDETENSENESASDETTDEATVEPSFVRAA